MENHVKTTEPVSEVDEFGVEAIELDGIDILEEDIVPCTCCGFGCSCN